MLHGKQQAQQALRSYVGQRTLRDKQPVVGKRSDRVINVDLPVSVVKINMAT